MAQLPALRIDRSARRQGLDEALRLVMGPVARRQPVNIERAQMLWPTVVGAVLARHTEPLSFTDGVLYVGARGRDWRDALFHQRIAIARRLRPSLPGLRRIFISNLPLIKQPPREAPPPPEPPHPEAEGLEHEGLRRAFGALLRARDRKAAAGTPR